MLAEIVGVGSFGEEQRWGEESLDLGTAYGVRWKQGQGQGQGPPTPTKGTEYGSRLVAGAVAGGVGAIRIQTGVRSGIDRDAYLGCGGYSKAHVLRDE
jgi:hypothetical protein